MTVVRLPERHESTKEVVENIRLDVIAAGVAFWSRSATKQVLQVDRDAGRRSASGRLRLHFAAKVEDGTY